MLKHLLLTLLFLSLFSSVRAGIRFDGQEGNDFKKDIAGLEVPIPAAPRAGSAINTRNKPPLKEWTVMVYLNGKNDLEDCGLIDANEMEKAGSSDKVNVVLELGRIAGYDASNGNWKGVRRYLIHKDTDTKHITSPVLQNLGISDMGDYNSIIAFGKWAKSAYPAKKYMLIIWNHGSGWVDTKSRSRKGISYDDETGHNLTTPQMDMVLKGIGGVDLYASDACLMQMAEVAAEIKDDVPYIVGSEDIMPVDGYTYDVLLEALKKDPSMDAEKLGRLVVDSVTDHYLANNQGSTQSLIRSAAIPGFIKAASEFADAVVAANDKALAKKSKEEAQKFSLWDNRDLYHFVKLMAEGSASAAVKEKGEALMKYIKDTLVLYNRTANGLSGWSMANYDNAYGVAVFIPGYTVHPSYANLAWAKQSTWDEMLAWMALP